MTKIATNIHQILSLVSHGDYTLDLKIAFEIIIILACFLWVLNRIRGTQAARLLKGVVVLICLYLLSWLAGLTLITYIMHQLFPIAVIAFIIIFQPEVRRGLGYLGRSTSFKIDPLSYGIKNDQTTYAINQIISAVKELSRSKIGALIVVEPLEGKRDYLSPGTSVNADVSSNLLLSIFFPKSPLHDGAVIIRENKIIAAGVILRMTADPNLSYKYGTRHRAAIGLSEMYDSLCIVISEETGSISAASHGLLVKYENAEELADPLIYIYSNKEKPSNSLHSFLSLFSRAKENSNISSNTEAEEGKKEQV